MFFSAALVGLVLASAASAAPTAIELNTPELNSTKWTPDHVLKHDEVILYGEDGRMEIVHESVYEQLIGQHGFDLEAPEIDEAFLNSTDDKVLDARADCSYTTALITDKTENFVDWDVQMSPVVIASVGAMDVYVSSGYSVSNSVTVSGEGELKFIKDRLGASFGVSYTRTWTTQTVINIKGTVPKGWSGVMITRPFKTRRYGRNMRGCIGSQKQIGTWMADSYQEGSYAGVKWVSGAISMCAKKQFPLTRCNGSGKFI
ncbi:hypothetical protein BGZ61DRAFT_565594 [Ilyonectria robusta]|uniref:uncharacterized protein n=1 Tax=Ilyonectria robusta TaxID=1079257 RepID=UPI001E8DD316|nr:uncharacterized protein BGZ61DRAFT_565594 [Ilyonectria robusta]KAH8733572.1 hypothetical protein BGZ61DRAFT_565594 [Ilyonectria robusta]